MPRKLYNEKFAPRVEEEKIQYMLRDVDVKAMIDDGTIGDQHFLIQAIARSMMERKFKDDSEK